MLTGDAMHREAGFTYVGAMVLIVIMGILLASAGEVWHLAQKREKEQELLFVGHQMRRSLTLYYAQTPGMAIRYPLSLEELLKDPRYPGTQRYLRKIFPDPITGSTQWGLIKGPSGEIFGVHSLSEEEPVKKSNFSLVDKNFEGKKKYSEWVFMAAPGQLVAPVRKP